MANRFGGYWTEQKIDIFLKYAKAYLDIMRRYKYFPLIYFDGFAGSGEIDIEEKSYTVNSLIEGIAIKMLQLDHPKKFDIYYFVDKDIKKLDNLKKNIENKGLDNQNCFFVHADSNDKLNSLTDFLQKKENRFHKALVLLDPYGISVKWSSLAACKDLPIDLWLLVPSGIGINRNLEGSGNIKPEVMNRISEFLGMPEEEIRSKFYSTKTINTLFGDETSNQRENDFVNKLMALYRDRLLGVWKYASKPFPMYNSKNVRMYDFIFASNKEAGLRIANDIINKELSSMHGRQQH